MGGIQESNLNSNMVFSQSLHPEQLPSGPPCPERCLPPCLQTEGYRTSSPATRASFSPHLLGSQTLLDHVARDGIVLNGLGGFPLTPEPITVSLLPTSRAGLGARGARTTWLLSHGEGEMGLWEATTICQFSHPVIFPLE